MKLHANARTCPKSRRLLVERIDAGWSVIDAAEAAGITDRTARRWMARWRAEGAQIVGGCCGVRPEHLLAARTALGHSKPGHDRPDPRPEDSGARNGAGRVATEMPLSPLVMLIQR